jgi:deoxyadenosine/deoxycytidine kinase
MTKHPYIGFEGPLAAGKTTLAQLLGEHIGAKVILEDVEGNEFLADFYGDRPRWALGMQLSFLRSRHEQLKTVASSRSEAVVADYTQAKDAIFARTLLQDRELRLYEGLSTSLNTGVARPDLIVYLNANNDVLLARIRGRGRAYEVSVDGKYLDLVRGAYEQHFREVRNVKLLRYDTSTLNLSSQLQLTGLYEIILSAASGF